MRNLKKFTAIALAATMTIGSTMTVFAEDTPSTETSSDGSGSYEGGEMKYPTLSVTLPTIPAGTYDYVADPNELIDKTKGDDGSAAKDSNSTYTGTTGIYFLTSTADDGKKTYTQDSAALSLTNENAQDIDVTVKLEQKTAGDAIIKYADSATFEAEDKENKLYLAITDGAAQNPKVAALSASNAATITTTVEGVEENFEAGYNSTDSKYEYTLKDEADLVDWNDCSFNMTGALNKGATWGDNVTFPEIKVTWSYAEHQDATPMATIGITNGAAAIRLATGLNAVANKITSVTVDGNATTNYSVTNTGAIIVNGITSAGAHTVVIVYDGTTYSGTATVS